MNAETTRLLQHWVNSDQPIPDSSEKPGPRQCCAEFAIVTECDGEIDHLWCGVCDRRWTQPCSVEDLVTVVAL